MTRPLAVILALASSILLVAGFVLDSPDQGSFRVYGKLALMIGFLISAFYCGFAIVHVVQHIANPVSRTWGFLTIVVCPIPAALIYFLTHYQALRRKGAGNVLLSARKSEDENHYFTLTEEELERFLLCNRHPALLHPNLQEETTQFEVPRTFAENQSKLVRAAWCIAPLGFGLIIGLPMAIMFQTGGGMVVAITCMILVFLPIAAYCHHLNRCPSCKTLLGKTHKPKFCPQCGIALRPEVIRPLDLEE
ncbi:MAG: hypothetical protein CMO55_00115 [Verrucomicrobiales bacterium]|nr:hypothetical protein [Verrucomicrobiales bacterium]